MTVLARISMAEDSAVNGGVVGSTPTVPAIFALALPSGRTRTFGLVGGSVPFSTKPPASTYPAQGNTAIFSSLFCVAILSGAYLSYAVRSPADASFGNG